MKKTLIALALLAAVPFAASASELSYSYLEGGYHRTDLDGGIDADGWGLGGSAAFGDTGFHIFGNWSQQEIDNTSLDFDQWRLGFGYAHGLSDSVDLVGRLAYERIDLGGGFDADGYSAEVGLRAALAPKFEGWIFAGYADSDDVSGDFYGRLGGQFKFNQRWGLVGEFTAQEDANAFFIGPRFSF